MKLIVMPNDTTLEMLLSEQDYQLVMKVAKEKLGEKALAVNRIKPIFTSALLTEETNGGEGEKKDSSD
ncbi:MAG: hypothetical protein EOO96_11135, partial [Pedobacter sp.]